MTRDSLLNLGAVWRHGGTILAGIGVPPADPVPSGPRVVCECTQCPTWCIGGDRAEALNRLAGHRRRCHAITRDPSGHG